MHAHMATWPLTRRYRLYLTRVDEPRQRPTMTRYESPAQAWEAMGRRILDLVLAGLVEVTCEQGPPRWAPPVSPPAHKNPSIVVTYPPIRYGRSRASTRERCRIWYCDSDVCMGRPMQPNTR
jgi:hypothetical protein